MHAEKELLAIDGIFQPPCMFLVSVCLALPILVELIKNQI